MRAVNSDTSESDDPDTDAETNVRHQAGTIVWRCAVRDLSGIADTDVLVNAIDPAGMAGDGGIAVIGARRRHRDRACDDQKYSDGH